MSNDVKDMKIDYEELDRVYKGFLPPSKTCPLDRLPCKKENCAWWCEWGRCCAMVAIPAELSDRIGEIATILGMK